MPRLRWTLWFRLRFRCQDLFVFFEFNHIFYRGVDRFIFLLDHSNESCLVAENLVLNTQ